MSAQLKWLIVVSVFFAHTALFAHAVHATDVDLTTFPGTSTPVPNGTVLSDQWRSIGILFGASPGNVVPIKDFGDALFFNPDVFGNVAVFTFVDPGTAMSAQAVRFSIRPFFNPGESAQLVGLDASGNVVAEDDVVPADIGGSNKSITMTITGVFRTVEWRTQGNPGIAADTIQFDLLPRAPAPAMHHGVMVFVALSLAILGIRRVRIVRNSHPQ